METTTSPVPAPLPPDEADKGSGETDIRLSQATAKATEIVAET